jgi:hypothetical protein
MADTRASFESAKIGNAKTKKENKVTLFSPVADLDTFHAENFTEASVEEATPDAALSRAKL